MVEGQPPFFIQSLHVIDTQKVLKIINNVTILMACTAFYEWGVGLLFTSDFSNAACLHDLSYIHMHGLIAGICGANCGTYLL